MTANHSAQRVSLMLRQANQHRSAGLSRTLLTSVITFCVLAFPSASFAQWVEQHPPTTESFRGMSVVDIDIVWASGTHGTFMWTTNRGGEWHVGSVPGAASLDFRAVHAASLDTVYLMAAAQDTARIYKTTDRGQHWTLQYDDVSKGAFLDDIAFFDPLHGLALGDPVQGRFTILETHDGGAHWQHIPDNAIPTALPGEAAFAASGTSLVTCGPRNAWFATGGGRVSRVFRTHDAGRSWIASETPIKAASASAGIFSLACRDERSGIAVGGNYSTPDTTAVTVAYTSDGGATWIAAPPSSANAYLSGVAYIDPASGNRAIGVGTGGTALSNDGGRTWERLDSLSLNVVASLHQRGAVLAAGAHGTVVARSLGARLALFGRWPPSYGREHLAPSRN